MNFIKRLIPNNIKQEAKYLLYDLLKIPYNRFFVPLDIIRWIPNNTPVSFIDIGASVGNFSIPLTQFYKIKKGFLIEPVEKSVTVLREKFTDGKIFEILNIAVAGTNGTANFNSYNDDFLSSFLQFDNAYETDSISAEYNKVEVKTKTLDSIISDYDIDVVDILKIDVQGTEQTVLNSGLNALKKVKLIYIEISFKPLYTGSCTFFDIYELLNNNNFRLVSIQEGYRAANGELLQGDAIFINNAFFK